jgi:transcriptional regulator with XRE-family HTH domain
MPQSLGERIAQARREKSVRDRADVRPVDVARALEVSAAAVSDWEADKKTPREELLTRLADFLGVTPAFLRYGVREAPAAVVPAGAIVHSYTEEERQADAIQAEKDRAAIAARRRKRRKAAGDQ